MSFKFGLTDVSKGYIGDTTIKKIYVGSNLVYEEQQVGYALSNFIPVLGEATINGVRTPVITNLSELQQVLSTDGKTLSDLQYGLVIKRHHKGEYMNERYHPTYEYESDAYNYPTTWGHVYSSYHDEYQSSTHFTISGALSSPYICFNNFATEHGIFFALRAKNTIANAWNMRDLYYYKINFGIRLRYNSIPDSYSKKSSNSWRVDDSYVDKSLGRVDWIIDSTVGWNSSRGTDYRYD